MRTRDIVYSISQEQRDIENIIFGRVSNSAITFVYWLAKQPQFAQDLIDKMAKRLCSGKEALYIPVGCMTPEKQVWLQKEGFEVSYDKRIHEYKINLI